MPAETVDTYTFQPGERSTFSASQEDESKPKKPKKKEERLPNVEALKEDERN